MIFFTSSKTKKLPRAARKGLAPRAEFLAHGKERFLAAYDASPLAMSARPAGPHYATIFFKTGIGVLAALCVAAGVSAYADTTNVPVTNPLYPLKRLGESVQLALAPASEQPQLQATFAVRRASEIDALQNANPTSTLIPQLATALDEDISGSLAAETVPGNSNEDNASNTEPGSGRGHGREDAGMAPTTTSTTSTVVASVTTSIITAPSSQPTGSMGVYCAAFNMSNSGTLFGRLESNLNRHQGALEQFIKQCGDDRNSGDATTTAIASTTDTGNAATATVSAISTFHASATTAASTTASTSRKSRDRGIRIDTGL